MTSEIPIRQLVVIVMSVLPEVLVHHMLVPLYPFIAKTLAPYSRYKSIGYYAALLQSAYFFPTIFMNVIWGYLGDTYGKRRALAVGLAGYAIGTITLGLSFFSLI